MDISHDMHVSLQTSSKRDTILGVSSTSGSASGTTEGETSPLWWSGIRASCTEAFSEFFGTLILILFGNGVVAQVILSHNQKGDYQSISWGWGLGCMLGVYVSGKSGSHMNPAVTFANCVLRKFPWRKLPIYALSQLLGGMCAAAIIYGNYKSAIDVYEGGSNIRTVPGYSDTATGGIFCTYPAEFMTRTGQFFSEFLASSILQFIIFALCDDTNLGAKQMMPLAMFFTIFGIGACFGWETGYAINLARDFGPRLVSYMIGYGPEVWRAGDYYFWIPLIVPFLGCTFGGWLYDMFLYVGPNSAVNTPYIGLRRLIRPIPEKHHDAQGDV
ncbi:putative aquaglyceroporin [Aspergillus cavernicola]|uniref:Aquaglyceroporin n=1 Tax=Aspergillus cavernicola TaxID=176166 RepID=A0ABR4IHE9_9EURO